MSADRRAIVIVIVLVIVIVIRAGLFFVPRREAVWITA